MPIIYNLGCKLNQYEGNALGRALAAEQKTVVVNTCCVTREAEIKSRRRFRHARRKYPGYKIVATGCACLLHPEDYQEADRIVALPERSRAIIGAYPKPDRSRYFLKIQDGCTEPCTYCVVPKVRPALASKPLADIRQEVDWARDNGFGEVVLVGANIGLYGRETGGSLAVLTRDLAAGSNLPRFRISSIEPRFIDTSLIDALKTLNVCRHFHVPIQSADDSVLTAMGRICSRRDLERAVDLISDSFPDCAIGADLIVGFPNECDAAFDHTLDFVRSKPITHLHVFPYSPRPGTAAQPMGDPVPAAVKRERRLKLQAAVRERNFDFRRSQIGRVLDAVFERDSKGEPYGLTDNYLRVHIAGVKTAGPRIRVRIDRVETHGLSGEMVE